MALDTLNVSNRNGGRPLSVVFRDGTSLGRISRRFGLGGVPDLGVSLGFGTGSGQANKAYFGLRTVSATSFDLVDLSGSLTDGLGNTFSPSALKLAVVAIVSPDGTKSLRVGPQNQSNAWQGPWGGTGSTVYQTVTHHWHFYSPVAGVAVTAGTGDVLPVYNPGATSVTYALLLAGV